MDAIRIYSSIPFDEIDGIIKKLPFKKDINVEYTDCRDKSNYSFFTKKCRQIEEITFLNTLSDFVFEIMIKFHAIDLIKDHVDNLLKDIRIVEKDRIVEEVYLLLIDKHYFINEKEDIKEKILDFLFENNALIIDGYIRFRNKEIYDLIEKSIKRVIGDMQLEMEYSEFIDVLKHFLDNQPPRINTINVIIEEEKYQILDKDNQEIEKNSISQILEEIYCDDLTKETYWLLP